MSPTLLLLLLLLVVAFLADEVFDGRMFRVDSVFSLSPVIREGQREREFKSKKRACCLLELLFASGGEGNCGS